MATRVAAIAATAITAVALASTGSSDIAGQLSFTPDFNLSWVLRNASSAGLGTAEFTLTWNAFYDWAAFGLHPAPGLGMPDAEVFICAPTAAGQPPFCQIGNTLGGYQQPSVDAQQYISLISSSRNATVATAVFSRTVAAAPGSPLSVPLTYNGENGLIYAGGPWSGAPLPQGLPLKHTTLNGRSQVRRTR